MWDAQCPATAPSPLTTWCVPVELMKELSHPQHWRSAASGPAKAPSALQTSRAMAVAARGVRSCEPTSTSLCQQKPLRQASHAPSIYRGSFFTLGRGRLFYPQYVLYDFKKISKTKAAFVVRLPRIYNFPVLAKRSYWKHVSI